MGLSAEQRRRHGSGKRRATSMQLALTQLSVSKPSVVPSSFSQLYRYGLRGKRYCQALTR